MSPNPDTSTGLSRNRRTAARAGARRTQKTQEALRQAFFALIRASGYDAVAIGDIVASANVGRSTFYEHYRSKDDILRASMAHLLAVLADSIGHEQPPASLNRVTAHFWENRRLANAVFTGTARRALLRTHTATIQERLVSLAREHRRRPALPFGLAARQIAEAQIVLLHAWLTSSTFCPSETLAEALHASSRAAALALIGAPLAAPRAP